MSGYGPPPTTPMQAAPHRSLNLDLPQMIGYAAGVLGILSFVWGFLNWFTDSAAGGAGVAGFSIAGSGAGAAIGLSIAAGAIAAADVFEKKQAGVLPAALAVAAFLVTLGLLIGKSAPGVSVGVGIGLILALITTILQAAGLAYVWLLATGRMRLPERRPAAGGWPAQPPPRHHDPYYPGPSMAGPGAPPPGQFPPQPPPGGYAPPAQPQYGPPPSYGHQYPGPPPEPPARSYAPPPPMSSPGTPPGEAPGQPNPGPSAPTSEPDEQPGAQWSPQTSYPGSREEPGHESEDGSANP